MKEYLLLIGMGFTAGFALGVLINIWCLSTTLAVGC